MANKIQINELIESVIEDNRRQLITLHQAVWSIRNDLIVGSSSSNADLSFFRDSFIRAVKTHLSADGGNSLLGDDGLYERLLCMPTDDFKKWLDHPG